MSKIIIFTGSTGAGHTLAARSLQEALTAAGHEVDILDAFKESGPLVNTLVEQGYKQLVDYMPGVYRKMYNKFDTYSKVYEVVFSSAKKIMRKDLLPEIAEEAPDLIVSTHPIVTNVLGQLKQEGDLDYPILAFVTDYKIHEVYLNQTIDAYVVGSEYTKKTMAGKGIDPDRIHPFGIPTRSEFSERPESPVNRDMTTIMLMGGSLGARQMKSAFLALLRAKSPLRIIVVCGKNKRLQRMIELIDAESFHGNNKAVEIHGFVNNISEMMDESDAIITKPGGLTSSEAIMKNIPIIIPYAYPGQEEENAHYLVSSGMALQIESVKSLSSVMDFLIENKYIINHMKEVMSEESSKHSIENTVNLCEELIAERASIRKN